MGRGGGGPYGHGEEPTLGSEFWMRRGEEGMRSGFGCGGLKVHPVATEVEHMIGVLGFGAQ